MTWAKTESEEVVAQKIQETHRAIVHLINQPGPVRKLGTTGGDCFIEAREHLGRNSEVGVKDHQDVTTRFGKSCAHGIALAFSWLLHQPNIRRVTLRHCFLQPCPQATKHP